jgi:hypothetical protein
LRSPCGDYRTHRPEVGHQRSELRRQCLHGGFRGFQLAHLVDQGQANLCDAVNGTITFTSPEGKHYEIGEKPATPMVRPRGWRLVEKHFLIDGEPSQLRSSISACSSSTMPAP